MFSNGVGGTVIVCVCGSCVSARVDCDIVVVGVARIEYGCIVGGVVVVDGVVVVVYSGVVVVVVVVRVGMSDVACVWICIVFDVVYDVVDIDV